MKITDQLMKAYHQTRRHRGQRIFLLGSFEYGELQKEFFERYYDSERPPSTVGLEYYNEMSAKFITGHIQFMGLPVVKFSGLSGIEVFEKMEYKI